MYNKLNRYMNRRKKDDERPITRTIKESSMDMQEAFKGSWPGPVAMVFFFYTGICQTLFKDRFTEIIFQIDVSDYFPCPVNRACD